MKKQFQIILRGFKIYASFPKPLLLARALSAMLQAGTPFINIWFSAQIINELAGARSQERLIQLVALTIGLNLAIMLLGNAAERWAAYCSDNNWLLTTYLLSDKMLSMDYIDVENPDIQQKHSNIRQHQMGMGFGFPRIFWSYGSIVDNFLRVVLSVAFAVTLFTRRVPEGSPLAFLDSPLAIVAVIIALCASIFLVPYIYMLGGRIWARASELNNRGNRFFSFYFFDMIHGSDKAKDMRIYNQNRIISRDCEYAGELDKWIKMSVGVGKLSMAGSMISQLANGLIYLFIALKAFAGAFGVGSIVQYVGAIMQFGNGFSALITNVGHLINNNPYLEKALDFLDTPNRKYQGTLPVEKRTDNKYTVEFKSVSFKYPGSENYALKNLNLKLEIGQRLAVVGMNGSGKTTMIKLLTRLYDPTEGEITLNGIDIKKYNYDEYLAIFGVVLQDFALLPFTLGQNVAASITYDPERVKETLSQSGFDERLVNMPHGLETYMYKNFEKEGVEISGGEAQKIALARALYKNAPFIVLDEPTAALDPIAEYEIYTKFNEIVGGKTAVYISHRLSSCRFCDDIAVFHEGELIQRGNHDILVSDPAGKYHELWHAQAQYYTESQTATG